MSKCSSSGIEGSFQAPCALWRIRVCAPVHEADCRRRRLAKGIDSLLDWFADNPRTPCQQSVPSVEIRGRRTAVLNLRDEDVAIWGLEDCVRAGVLVAKFLQRHEYIFASRG